MTELTRSNRRISQAAIATLVLVAALAAGVIGGVVGAQLNGGQILAARNVGAAQVVAAATKAPATDWAAYGERWQQQYLAMYPPKLDPNMVQYGIDWQRQYEQQHPQQ